MKKSRIISSIPSLLLVAILLSSTMSASADGTIGGGDGGPRSLAAGAFGRSLGPIVNEYGKIKLSIDALGMTTAQGNIRVDKPNGGRVRKALLFSATTGFTNYRLANGDVKIAGNDISWQEEISNSIYSYNYWADITNIVKPTIDAAPAGVLPLQISEQNSSNIDGEILAVIFDDPNQGTSNTIILNFGAQNIAGDTFTINTGSPINTNDPNLKLNLSLGISYGCVGDSTCEGGASAQYSRIDVNGRRVTSSAGGQDDGQLPNGSLITAGGIGDLEDNPLDPYAGPVNPRSDDELYNLKPFVNNNDTVIQINTINPSNDDNIFFAALMLTASTIQTISIEISLVNNPTTNDERAPYENIVRYFADAVFEESNGINKLGNVIFHTGGDFVESANIVWGAKGWPSSELAGYGVPGKHTNMYSVFQDGSGKGVDYDFMADNEHQRAAGYTLGHEFGHLYYSLSDEYKYTSNPLDCALTSLIFWLPHCTDIPVMNSIMNNQWNALLNNDYNWLNFSIAKNTSGDTSQYRIYEAAGWETLARPISQDPQLPWWSTVPIRLYHSDLASVKPDPDTDARIDLSPGTARSELNIIWDDALNNSSDSARVTTFAGSFPYTVELNSLLGRNISYPDPIVLEAFVHQDLNITDLNVTGSITLPNGSMQTVHFSDDGVPPDARQGDGLYSAILNYTMNGLYNINVTFDNHRLNGKLVAYGFQMSTDSNGNSVTYPFPEQVTDDLVVSKSLLISVGNVVSDDHGNTPDLATTVTSDDTPISGKIDYLGDADVFKIITLPTGSTFVRVTNLAFGISPHMRILGADKQTVLYELDLPSIGEGNYLNLELTQVPPGTIVYAEVTNKVGNFGGLYRLSVGTQLASDTVNMCFAINTFVSPLNSGTVSVNQISDGIINPPPRCRDDNQYPYGAVIRLTAYPEPGYIFNNWFGAISGSADAVDITMLKNESVVALFSKGADTTGVFRPSNGLLYLKNKNETGFADMALNYGMPSDYPVVGDWDGNGTVTIGIYRNGYFYLRNENTIGFANVVFAFGQPGDQPIAGDWDGDGVDTTGVFRPSTGQFLLRNSNSTGIAEMSFYLGNVGDVGIAGDWDGDGVDTTGVFRPSNGIIFLKNTNETGFADIALNYGIPGDRPVTGDWNNDGLDTIGVYRNGIFYLRNSNTVGFADMAFGLGNPGDMPIAGNWDGLP